jgi:outer membrane protein assembly factor BamB
MVSAVVAVGPAAAGPHVTVLQDTTYRSVSEFGSDTLLVREVTFERPIQSAQIDESDGILVAAMEETAQPERFSSTTTSDQPQARFVAYDLQAHRVKWEKVSPLLAMMTQGNRALLSERDQLADLISVEDGKKLADIHGMPIVWPDRVALRITDREVCRWDLESGLDLWRANRGTAGTFDSVIREDSVAYLIAEGIEKIDLEGGVLWSYAMRASRKDLYSDASGGTVHVRSLYGGSRATQLTAPPIIGDRDIYFAADTTVVRLDAASGEVRWKQNLSRTRNFSLMQRALGPPDAPEFLGRLVLRDAGRNILVASMGWASGPKYNLAADRPTVALLAKSDGHVVARVQIQGVRFLNDALSTPSGTYVVSSDRIVALDDSLDVRATLEAPVQIRPFGQFIEVGDAIVLTVGPGIAALSADTLGIVWSRRCGRVLAIEPDGFGPGDRYCVTTQGLVGLDTAAGLLPNSYYPLRSTWAEFHEGWVVMGAGRMVRVVTLLAHQPSHRVD